MGYIITLSIILTFSITLSIIFKKRIEEVIPVSIVEIILTIFICGLFDNLSIGVKIIGILTIIQLIFILVIIFKKEKEEQKIVIKRIITPGLFVYIGLFILSIFINKDRILEDYDEFTHWGVIIKNMFLYNTYGTNEESIVRFNEYPPFTAVFQYLFLGIQKVYREDTIIIAQNMLYFSIIIPITKKIKWNKSLIKLLAIIPLVIFIPMIFYKDFYLHILVDGILGIMFAYTIFSAFDKDENNIFKFLKILAGIVTLSLTKTTGITLAILSIVIMLIKNVFDRRKGIENSKKETKIIILITVITILIISMWYIKINNVEKKWDFTQMLSVQQEENEVNETRKEIALKFIRAIFEMEKITSKEFTVFITILLSICIQFYATKKMKDKNFTYYSIAMFISIIIWGIGLLVSYATIFDIYEAQNLTCFDRYMSTILLSYVIFVMLAIAQIEEKFTIKEGVAIVFIVIALIPLANIKEKYINSKNYIKTSKNNRYIYTQIKDYKDKLKSTDKILYIASSTESLEYIKYMNEYEIMPIKIEQILKGNFIGEQEFKEIVKNYTHVFIYQIESEEAEKIKGTFKENKVEIYTLYKVKNEENEFILEKERE